MLQQSLIIVIVSHWYFKLLVPWTNHDKMFLTKNSWFLDFCLFFWIVCNSWWYCRNVESGHIYHIYYTLSSREYSQAEPVIHNIQLEMENQKKKKRTITKFFDHLFYSFSLLRVYFYHYLVTRLCVFLPLSCN